MRVRSILLAATIAVAGAVGLGAGSASAAPPCQRLFSGPFDGIGAVSGLGELVCQNPDDPRDGQPIAVTLQSRAGAGAWTTVATGVGEATFFCDGSNVRQYRILQNPNVIRSFFCS